MFKLISIVVFVIAYASAKPAPQFVAYNSPFVASAAYAAAPYATSAVVSREYHGVSAPLIAASPYTAAYTSPYIAAPAYAYSAPLII